MTWKHLLRFARGLTLAAASASLFSCATTTAADETPATEVATVKPESTSVEEMKRVPFEDENYQWGYKDGRGEVVIPAQYMMAEEFKKGIAAVVEGDSWAYINPQGEILLRPFIFDNGPDYFSEGLARHVEDGKMGFFDEHGVVVIPATYTWVGIFADGRASYCVGCKQEPIGGEYWSMRGGHWGFLDRNGQEVIPAVYDLVYPFEGGVTTVKSKDYDLTIDIENGVLGVEEERFPFRFVLPAQWRLSLVEKGDERVSYLFKPLEGDASLLILRGSAAPIEADGRTEISTSTAQKLGDIDTQHTTWKEGERSGQRFELTLTEDTKVNYQIELVSSSAQQAEIEAILSSWSFL